MLYITEVNGRIFGLILTMLPKTCYNESVNWDFIRLKGALAQLGARHTGSVEATGSNPVCSILVSGGITYGNRKPENKAT